MSKSKLLDYFLDKQVLVIYKRPSENNGEAMMGVLIDMDDEHYYIGGDNESLFAVTKHSVRAIADATEAVEGFDKDKDILQ